MAQWSVLDLDQEQRNFFCLTILINDVGNKSLREYFKKQWPVVYQKVKGSLPPAPWTNIPNDAVEMNNIEKKLKLKPNDKAIFDSGDTEKWDFSLLSSVLLHSSDLGFVNPSSPEKDALKDLKDVRNDLVGHNTSSKIDDATFKLTWTKTCDALKLFGASQADFTAVEDVLNKPSETLVPILKKIVATEEDIRDSISKLIQKSEEKHKDFIGKMSQHNDEIKATIKEEGQLTRSLLKEHFEGQSSRHVLMPKDQRLILQQRLPNFQDDVIATDLLDNLPFLTQKQKDQIAHDEKNFQTSKGVRTLVEKLEEHEEGFGQFVQALGKADLGHVAVILDADFGEHDNEDKTKVDKEETNYVVVGSAVDVMISMRILDEKKRRLDLEQKTASSFSNGSSAESKTLRKEFQKVLPKGLYFHHTKQLGGNECTGEDSNARSAHTSHMDSVVVVFRVAKVSVLDELWKIYQDKTLDKKLQQVLISRKSISWNCSLEIVFQEKDYLAIKRILEGTDEDAETETDKEPSNSSPVDSEPGFSESEETSSLEDDKKLVKRDSQPEGTSRIKSAKPIPRVYLDDGTYNISRKLQLREYQKELAAPALEGKNTIICAPTNSGKTFVAMEIAKRHLDAYKDSKEASKNVPRPKVIFVVDKQNLVLQQRTRFGEYLTNYNISDISGNNSDVIPLHRMIQDNDVIVLTAGILVNALEDKSVNITDISLLVFDECHHANKDHPYNQIMQVYLDSKIKKNVQDMPQVVALTASLGVGKSITTEKAMEHILQMCANLDASNITTVRENIDELITNVTGHVPVRRIVPHVDHDAQNIFEIEINKTMEEIEAFVNGLRSNTPRPQTGPPVDRQVESYRQWIELLQNDREISDNRTRVTCVEQLRKYHEALLINNTVRIDDAIKYLAEYFDKLDPSKFTENCTHLQELYNQTMKRMLHDIDENGRPDNPLLKVLEKLIIEFHEKNEETGAKGILFTRTRDYTVAIKRWIKETEELKKILIPEVLVGSGDGDIGLSQTQQEAVIKKFKTGEVNIIIATTVAEEGLDISDCSYVIRYGMLGNEISSVQSRGRIRAKEGNYVYMPDSRRRGADHEIRNDYREILMETALVEVQDMDESLFLDRINGLQKQTLDELELRNEMEASFKSQYEEKDHISFLCKKCENYVCSSRDIRRYKKTNHVVVNPNVEKLFNVKERKKPEGHPGRYNEYKVHCKECDLDWGVLLLTKGAKWMCMKIKSFWVVIDESDKRNIKNWKDAPFTIEEVALDKLFELRKQLGQESDVHG